MKGTYELPPPPPSGIPDARFSTNSYAEAWGTGTHIIQVSSAGAPLTITAGNLGGHTLRMRDQVDGSLLDRVLAEGTAVQVPAALTALVLREDGPAPAEMPVEYALHQNYPNPFNPSTTIRYALPQKSFVTLKVYDALGQEVATLVNEEQEPGNKEVVFTATHLASGIYFYRLRAGSFSASSKMLLTK
jgi:hypothetical protein